MEFFNELRHLIAPETIVKAGYVIMALVIFAETGLLAGFFLPGDSLLVTAGIFAARGDLDLFLSQRTVDCLCNCRRCYRLLYRTACR